MNELILAPGAQVFLRGGDAVQFGVDATRAGVIETDQATALASALLAARRPIDRDSLQTGISAIGFSPAAARSLVADLVSYRILVAPPGGSLIILGRSRLARSTAALAEESGMSVRAPLRGESEYSYLSHADVDVPVLVIDRLAHSRTMAPLLSRFARTWVPAAILDGRGVIGPLRIQGEGPCPMCLDLHRSDRDGRWYSTVSQLPGGPHTPDPVTLAATAARVITVVQYLLGRHLEPPGSPRQQLASGSFLEVDPRSPTEHSSIIAPHPRCPVCWYY